jgi:tyrosine-protein phosphatase YwqE
LYIYNSSAFAQFTSFTGTKVRILTLQLVEQASADALSASQFTSFTGTKVQILTLQLVEQASADALSASTEVNDMRAEESEKLKQELEDARHSQLRASSR